MRMGMADALPCARRATAMGRARAQSVSTNTNAATGTRLVDVSFPTRFGQRCVCYDAVETFLTSSVH